MDFLKFIADMLATPAAQIDEDSEKKLLEIEKMKLDMKYTRVLLKNTSIQQRMTFITTLLAILGLIFTTFIQQKQFRNQQEQLNIQRKQHIDDMYSKSIQQLVASTKLQTQLLSVENLSIFLKPENKDYNRSLVSLLIGYAEADSSDELKNFIAQKIVENAPLIALKQLIGSNRAILANLPSTNILFYSDTEAAYITRDLANLNWTIGAIMQCVWKLRKIDSIDFSYTVLNTIQMRKTGSGFSIYTQVRATMDSFEFSNVTFNNAILSSLIFDNSRFTNVSFDGTNLIGCSFIDCTFSDSCSFESFDMNPEDYNSQEYKDHIFVPNFAVTNNIVDDFSPSWINCDITAKIFSPHRQSNQYKVFLNSCKMHIKTIDTTSVDQ